MRTAFRTTVAGATVAVLTVLPLAGVAGAEEPAPAPEGACAAERTEVSDARAAVVQLRVKFTLAKLHRDKLADKLAADTTLLEGVEGLEDEAESLEAADRAERKAAARAGREAAKAAREAARAERLAALEAAKAFKKAIKVEWEAAKAELREARQSYRACAEGSEPAPEPGTEPDPEPASAA